LTRRQAGRACALVIVISAQGSVPAWPGAKMVVDQDGTTVGTVGGGLLEKQAADAALEVMATGEARTLEVDLTEQAGHVCGGRVGLYVEPVMPRPRLVIVGAGHVGKALCTAASFAGFLVTVADDRPEFADTKFLPEADQVLVHDFETLFSALSCGPESFIVAATRGHAHDYTVIRNALATPARYVGLLGSKRKKAGFFARLQAEGFSRGDLARIRTPVGIGIGAVTPQEIAVSIVAELIQTRRCHGSPGCGHCASGGSLDANGPAKTTAPCPG